MSGRLAFAVAAVALALPGGVAESQTTPDTSPPVIALEIVGRLGANGWHIENTTLRWTPQDPQSGISKEEGCDADTVTEETAGKSYTCTATNGAGLKFSATYVVKLDKFAPTIRRVTARPPDANRWFNHRIDFAPRGGGQRLGHELQPDPVLRRPEHAEPEDRRQVPGRGGAPGLRRALPQVRRDAAAARPGCAQPAA